MPVVVALMRYPLKSAQGERLEVATVEQGGLRGDRAWACIDALDGTVGTAKHPRRWGRLLDIGTTLLDVDTTQLDVDTTILDIGTTQPGVGTEHPDDTDTPRLMLRIDGRQVLAGTSQADDAISHYLGRPVHLTRDVPPHARLHRQQPDDAGLIPDWMDGARPGQETITPLAGAARTGRFVDFGAVHIVTTGALSALAGRLGGGYVAMERFRPNLVIDAAHDPEPGQEIRLGDVVLRTVLPTPRCVVPGLGSGAVPADRPLLATLARHHRASVAGYGRAACFGTYAEVLRPGRLHLGVRVGMAQPNETHEQHE